MRHWRHIGVCGVTFIFQFARLNTNDSQSFSTENNIGIQRCRLLSKGSQVATATRMRPCSDYRRRRKEVRVTIVLDRSKLTKFCYYLTRISQLVKRCKFYVKSQYWFHLSDGREIPTFVSLNIGETGKVKQCWKLREVWPNYLQILFWVSI